MKKRPSSRGRPEEERAQSQGRSGVPARATREGAARAKKVARAEAEAAEVAGGAASGRGSRWQLRSGQSRSRSKAARAEARNQGVAAAAAFNFLAVKPFNFFLAIECPCNAASRYHRSASVMFS